MEATGLLMLPLILFLSFTANGVSASRGISNTVDQPPAVVDSLGNTLQRGQYYYLSPIIPLSGLCTPAIVPAIFRPGTVWLQLEIEVFTYGIRGLPVKFSPVELTEDKTIHESTDLNIKFTDEPSLVSGRGSSVLKVGELGDEFVGLGGAEEDRKSWFKIEKASERNDGVHKLVSSFSSADIGISKRTYGAQRLAPADTPVRFVFRPVEDETSASKVF